MWLTVFHQRSPRPIRIGKRIVGAEDPGAGGRRRDAGTCGLPYLKGAIFQRGSRKHSLLLRLRAALVARPELRLDVPLR